MRPTAVLPALVLVGGMVLSVPDHGRANEPDDFQPTVGFLKLPAGWKWGACSAVAVNRQGEIYVMHRGEHPVLVFQADGTFLRSWGDDYFKKGHGLRVDRHDNVWTSDIETHQVLKFDPKGKLLLALGTGQPGTGVNEFNKPSDIAFGPDGEFYVSDGYVNTRVLKFSPAGKFLKSWGTPGKGPGEFDLLHSIIVDARGRVLVGDRNNDRIQLFDREGKYLESWRGFAPYGLTLDAEGSLFVATGDEHEILRLDDQGRVTRRWGRKGTALGEFNLPHMLTCDGRGNLYVAEIDGSRVQKLVRRKP